MSARGVLRIVEDDQLGFWCPGCKEMHVVGNAAWQFNGDYESPSFSPSILVTCGHYTPGRKATDACWCTYNREHPEAPSKFHCFRCHSYVKGGRIEFLSDCTHKLAGTTARLEAPPV